MVAEKSVFCFSSSFIFSDDDVKLVCNYNWYFLWLAQDKFDVVCDNYWKNFNEGWRIGIQNSFTRN